MTAHLSASDYRAMQAKGMHETRDLTPAVIDLAHSLGWLVHHSRPAQTKDGWRTPLSGDAGCPDLLMVHPSAGVVLAELKSERGQLSDHQQKWGTVLRKVATSSGLNDGTVRYYVWRPSDLLNGAIREVLTCR